VVVGEAHRCERQLGHQPAVDVVISCQDQVQDVAADVSWNADVLSESMVHEHVSSTTVQLSSQRSRHVEVTDNDEPTVQQSLVFRVARLV